MGWRFRRSRQILPGLRMTVTRDGVGWSLGGRWARINVSPTGRLSRTLSLPGTGLSHHTTLRRRPPLRVPAPPLAATTTATTATTATAHPPAPAAPASAPSSTAAAAVRPVVRLRRTS